MAPGDQVSGVAVVAEVIEPNCHIQSDWIDKCSSMDFSLSYESGERRLRLVVGIDFSRKLKEEMETLRRTAERDYMIYRELWVGYPRYHEDPRWHQYILDKYGIEETEISQRYRETKRKEKT